MAATDNYTETSTSDTQENPTNVYDNFQLSKFLEERKKKISRISPNILAIHKKTDRVLTNQTAKEKEFYTKRGKYYPKGSLYHIHYTTDLEVYYMTGGEHNERTKLIFRKSIFDNDFDYYNTLNRQEVVQIKSSTTLPTEEDYRMGRMTRYFAKKANETSSPAFEVSEADFESSPLYNFTSILWYIRGNKLRVGKLNQREIKIASQNIPNIEKLLPIFQYFRSSKVLSIKEDIEKRLGIVGEEPTTEEQLGEEDTTTTTTTTTSADPKDDTDTTTTGGSYTQTQDPIIDTDPKDNMDATTAVGSTGGKGGDDDTGAVDTSNVNSNNY